MKKKTPKIKNKVEIIKTEDDLIKLEEDVTSTEDVKTLNSQENVEVLEKSDAKNEETPVVSNATENKTLKSELPTKEQETIIENSALEVKDAKELVEKPAISVNVAQVKYKPNGWDTFGFVISILSFVLFIVNLFASYSFLTVIVYYIVMVLIIIITLGLIMFKPEFQEFFNAGEKLEQLSLMLSQVGYYLCYGIIALSTLSIVILAINKRYSKRTVGIVLASVALVLTVITLVVHFVAPFGYFGLAEMISN